MVKWLNSEITAEALAELASGTGLPDFVFHLAGGSTVGASLSAPLEDFTRTTATTALLLEWLRTHSPGSKLVAASSAAVYGGTAGAPAQESTSPAPISPYGFHKLIMEQICREYSQVFGLQTAVFRMFSVYGEGLRKQLLWDCGMKLMAPVESIELGGTGDELRDWIHVDDAVAMMHRIADIASVDSPIFNGGSGVAVTVREVVLLLASCLRRSVQVRFSGIRRPGDPIALVADTRRAASLGVSRQIPLDVGVQRYADWFKLARGD
jgi:UDP-glucose 4-epimerase